MKYDPQKHHRRSIRLQGYDYSRPGAYFVTIVTYGRVCLFGEIVEGRMRLNGVGQIVQREWRRLGQRFPNVQLGTFMIMPNHIHGILIIHGDVVGATLSSQTRHPSGKENEPTEALSGNSGSPLPPRPHGPAAGSLGAIIGQFKSRITKRLWTHAGLSGTPIWQRNYYEQIIRTDDEHRRIHAYIASNPAHWNTDDQNPARPQ